MKMVLLSGGVGGARLARGLAQLEDVELTVVVNVGDDEEVYGLHLSPDIDTVIYTLAGVEGNQGWGIRDDSGEVMGGLSKLGMDTYLFLGDRDLATNLYRSAVERRGVSLSEATAQIAHSFGVSTSILPATDQPLRTQLQTQAGEWLDFQDYFVRRQHQDPIRSVRFVGIDTAEPAPGVVAAIRAAEVVIIAPSNPVLSVWPILAVTKILTELLSRPPVIAVSPLMGGKAVKGPAAEVLAGMGFAAGNSGIVAAYEHVLGPGGLGGLVVDNADRSDRSLENDRMVVGVTDTLIDTPDRSRRLAEWLLAWFESGSVNPRGRVGAQV